MINVCGAIVLMWICETIIVPIGLNIDIVTPQCPHWCLSRAVCNGAVKHWNLVRLRRYVVAL